MSITVVKYFYDELGFEFTFLMCMCFMFFGIPEKEIRELEICLRRSKMGLVK